MGGRVGYGAAVAASTGSPHRGGGPSRAGGTARGSSLWHVPALQLRPADVTALVLVFLGAALAATSFRTLRWYSVDAATDSAGQGFTFTDLHTNADHLGAPVAAAYFDKLAWGLMALVVLLTLAARVASPLRRLLRVLGFLVGVAGGVLTIYALAQLFNAQRVAGGSDHGVLHNASTGLWTALLAYLLAALGAVLGSGEPGPQGTRSPRL